MRDSLTGGGSGVAFRTRSRVRDIRAVATRQRLLGQERADPLSKAMHTEAAMSCDKWASELEQTAETIEKIHQTRQGMLDLIRELSTEGGEH